MPDDLSEIQPPYALAMMICDFVHRDPSTGKATLLGCFTSVFSQNFPATLPPMSVFFVLTDGRGTCNLSLKLVDAEEERDPVYEVEMEARFDDPLASIEAAVSLSGVVVPEPGEYRFQLFSGHAPIVERRLMVLPPPTPPTGAEQ